MPCPAAVSAAAVWLLLLLAALGPGLSHPAEDNADFSLCSQCFYRQTPPPLGDYSSTGPSPLRPRCHTLPGGQAFATLSRPTCDTAVFSAYRLSRGWEEEEERGGDSVTFEEEDHIKVAVPALLRGADDPVSPADSPLQQWDSTVTTLLRSNILPLCSGLKGDVYVLTGAGRPLWAAAEDGDEGCQTEEPLWSAVCCDAPEGKIGFSLGLIKKAGEEEDRVVRVEELEEALGGAELFSGGCGGADEEALGLRVGPPSDGHPENVETLDTDVAGENTEAEGSNKDIGESEDEDISEDTGESEDSKSESNGADLAQESSAGETTSESRPNDEEQSHVSQGRAFTAESPDPSADRETVDERETDTNSSSILYYVLSTTVAIVKAPLRPVFSTITQLPGQVTYVLQEDLGVLCSLPRDTFSLFKLLTSDLFSGLGRAAEMLLCVGETLFFSTYYCTSSMAGALMASCHTGFTGVGTLAGDTVGVFRGALDKTWWVTKFFGGRLWDQSEGYVGAVASEVGDQAQTVGGGCGRLVWRSGTGVFNVFRMGFGFVFGTVDLLFGAMREVSGQGSE